MLRHIAAILFSCGLLLACSDSEVAENKIWSDISGVEEILSGKGEVRLEASDKKQLLISEWLGSASANLLAKPSELTRSQPKNSVETDKSWQSSLPIAFVPAPRKLAKDYRYVLSSNDFTVGLGASSFAIAALTSAQLKPGTISANLWRWSFLGADRQSLPVVGKPLQGVSHQYIGPKKHWQSDVDRYSHVTYPSLYQGTDLVVKAVGSNLGYAFFLDHAEDSQLIKIRVEGSKSVQLDKNNNLVVAGVDGAAVHSAPKAFEFIDGRKVAVPVSFQLLDSNTIGFDVDYAHRHSVLVIDPEIHFVSYVGGEGGEGTRFDVQLSGQRRQTIGLSVTNADQVLVASKAASADMLLGQPGEIAGLSDAFVLSFDPNYIQNSAMDRINYMTFYGGSGIDFATDVVAISDGGAYFAGHSRSGDLELMADVVGPEQLESGAFLAHLDEQGRLVNASMIGENQSFYITTLALGGDADSGLYIAGHAAEPVDSNDDSEATAGAFSSSYAGGGRDGFVAKLNASLSAYHYLTFLGGDDDDLIHDLAVQHGRAYVVGKTRSRNFPVTEFPQQAEITAPEISCTLAAGALYCFDGFLAAVNADGSDLAFSTYFGTPYPDSINGVAISENRRITVVGGHRFNSVSMTPQEVGDSEAFVAEFASDGILLSDTGFVGEYAVAEDVFVDGQGIAYIVGATDRIGMEDDLLHGNSGDNDLFYASYESPLGTRDLFRYVGGTDRDFGLAIDGYGGASEEASGMCLATAGVTFSAGISTQGALPDGQEYSGSGDLLLAGLCIIEGDIPSPVTFHKAGPNTLRPGEIGQYQITVDNNNGDISGRLTVKDQIHDLLSVEGRSSDCVVGLDPQLVTCESSAPGGLLTFSIDVRLSGEACAPEQPEFIENTATFMVEGYPEQISEPVNTRILCDPGGHGGGEDPVACAIGQVADPDGGCCGDVNGDRICDDVCPAEMGLPFSVELPHERCVAAQVCGVICTNVCDGWEVGSNCWFGDYYSYCPKFSCQAPSPNLQLHESWQDR